MKKLFYKTIIAASVCGMVFTGCVSDEADQPEPVTDPPFTSGLYVVGAKPKTASSAKAVAAETENIIFTGGDIVSFTVSSGEIVFDDARTEAIMAGVALHSELDFYIDGTPVFTPAIRIHPGYGETFEDFDLQFRTASPEIYDGVKVYLTDVYMNIDTLPEAERLIKQQEMEANKAKRKKELDVLISYLDAAGKIVDETEDPPVIIEPSPDLTGIKIKDNPCETLKYIRQIGTDFDSALDSLLIIKNISTETAKTPLDVIFDADDRQFYGIEYGGAGRYTDVLDTKGHWYERTYKCADVSNKKTTGYVVGYDACSGVQIKDGTGNAGGYVLISENLTDTIAAYNMPDNLFSYPEEIMPANVFGFNLFPKEYRFTYKVDIIYRPVTEQERNEVIRPCITSYPALYNFEPVYVSVILITKKDK